MIDSIKHIEVNGIKYPMALTLNVLEDIQIKYGSIAAWGKKLEPEKVENKETGEIEVQEPSLKDIIWTMQQVINEGIDIENEENGTNRPFLSHKQVGRIITKIGIKESGSIIQELTVNSTSKSDLEDNEDEEKNLNTVQS